MNRTTLIRRKIRSSADSIWQEQGDVSITITRGETSLQLVIPFTLLWFTLRDISIESQVAAITHFPDDFKRMIASITETGERS